MTTLQYKDYQGSVTFEDGALVIQILHIDDTITTTCDSASGAQTAFEELVDDYIETCRVVGKEPSKPFKGTFNVRVGSVLHRNAAVSAMDRGETLNTWITGAVEQRLRRDQILKSIRDVFQISPWAGIPRVSRYEGAAFRVAQTSHRHHTIVQFAEPPEMGKVRARQIMEMFPITNQWHVTKDAVN